MGKAEGIAEGRTEGKRQKQLEIAKKSLKENIDIETLAIKLIEALVEQRAVNRATYENILKKYG